jgi:phosphate uptake regulator
MFKQLLNIFKKGTLLDKAFDRSCEMIDITHEMFKEIRKQLRVDKNYKFSFDIRDQDIAVNKYEREVRRHVFNHLCVGGMEDLNSGLVLTSIIIDIERIGDYTKNIVELSQSRKNILKGGKYGEDLLKVEDAIEETFVIVRDVFENADRKKAEELITKYKWVNKLCDKHIDDYLNENDDTVTIGQSAALTLYYRYLKRINSHLRNVASSVVNPFPRIGFKIKKKDQDLN